MTIEAVEGERVTCIWAAKSGVIRSRMIPKSCLKLSNTADGTIIFMPQPMLNDEGVKAFLSGDYVPGGAN
jgi:hypothetical protein